MQQFIEKYQDEIQGVLSGFDRLVFRATPRRLNSLYKDHGRDIMVAKGMQEYLWQNGILFKDFGRHVKQVSQRVKSAFLKPFAEKNRPLIYIRSPKLDKDELARQIAAKDK